MDDMYPDDGPDEESSSDSPAKDKSKKEKDEPNTELVSKSFLGMDEDDEAEEGHICKVRVVKDYGSEVEIEYIKHDKKDKKHKKDSDNDEEMSADDEIDEIESSSMMKG